MTMEKIEKAEVLKEKYITPDSTYDGIFSKTAQFMTPAIGINVTHPLVWKYFVNAFLTDMEHKHEYERPIFMLFSIENLKSNEWRRVYDRLIQSKNFISEYDIGIQNNKYLLMMVFQIPEEYKMDYINFKMGRYSLFSEEYKKKFPKYLDSKKQKKNIHWQIINKDEDLKREVETEYNMEYGELDLPTVWRGKEYPPASEIWEKPRRERESYRYSEKNAASK